MSNEQAEKRIADLIQQCQDAHRLLERVRQDGGQTGAVESTIADLFSEIGSEMFHLKHPSTSEKSSDAPPPVATSADAITLIDAPATSDPEPSLASLATEIIAEDTELPDDITDLPVPSGEPSGDAEGWYTEEVPKPGPLFDPGDLQLGDMDEVPLTDESLEFTADLDTHSGQWTLAQARHETQRVGQPLALLMEENASWVQSLSGFVNKAQAPESGGLEESVTRLLWACTQMAFICPGLPESIQASLTAWLGARARALQSELSADLRLRLALENLTGFHADNGLLEVAALHEGGPSETGSWPTDVDAWLIILSTPKTKS